MKLYHGSNTAVTAPQLLKIQRALDFGKGFYTTSDYEQAKQWAERAVNFRASGSPIISCYDIEENMLSNLKILRFKKPDSAWLDYVAANRKYKNNDDWDLVIEPVANDQTFPTILLYLDGYLDAESAIRQLLPQKLKDQYTFKTEKALSLLTFIEVKEL